MPALRKILGSVSSNVLPVPEFTVFKIIRVGATLCRRCLQPRGRGCCAHET